MQQQQHHAQTFSSASIRQGICLKNHKAHTPDKTFFSLGIGTSSGISAACANNSSNSSSSPPNPQSSNQHLPKNTSISNQNENKDSLTSPNNSQLSKIQKSPSDSLSSKNETEKIRSGKSRNKEGILYKYKYILYISKNIEFYNFTDFFHSFPLNFIQLSCQLLTNNCYHHTQN